jgi:hypothetical protein
LAAIGVVTPLPLGDVAVTTTGPVELDVHCAPVAATDTSRLTLTHPTPHVLEPGNWGATAQQTSAVVLLGVIVTLSLVWVGVVAEIGTVAAAAELAKGWVMPKPTSRVKTSGGEVFPARSVE